MSTKNAVDKNPGTWQAVLILALLLALSSAGLVQKYFGMAGVVANLLGAAAILGLVVRFGRVGSAIFERRLTQWVALVVVLLGLGYCVTHPYEDGRGVGKSSDRDEGLEIAVTRVISGETPYYPDNPVAGPLSVLPGAISLSVPFVIMGDVGYQNVFWIAVVMVVGAAWSGHGALAAGLPLALMAGSPSFLHEFVSGGDMIANGMYVAVLMGWSFREWSGKAGGVRGSGAGGYWSDAPDAQHSRHGKWIWPSTVLLGIAMASRPNFLLLYPLFACGLWRVVGFRAAAMASGVAALVSLCMILPFYLHDPAGFTPWIARKKVAIADHVLPWAGAAMIGMTVILSLVGALALLRGRKPDKPLVDVYRWCALVTLCPMICAIMVRSWLAGALDFGFMLDRFGVMYLGFAVMGWGEALIGEVGRTGSSPSRRRPVAPGAVIGC